MSSRKFLPYTQRQSVTIEIVVAVVVFHNFAIHRLHKDYYCKFYAFPRVALLKSTGLFSTEFNAKPTPYLILRINMNFFLTIIYSQEIYAIKFYAKKQPNFVIQNYNGFNWNLKKVYLSFDIALNATISLVGATTCLCCVFCLTEAFIWTKKNFGSKLNVILIHMVLEISSMKTFLSHRYGGI